MDLTYAPGELDYKHEKKGNNSDMKREHDSVDDFEHLDPDLSPVDTQKGFSTVEKFDAKPDAGTISEKSIVDLDFPEKLIDDLSNYDKQVGPIAKSSEPVSDVLETKDLLSDFDLDMQPSTGILDSNIQSKSNLLDLHIPRDSSPVIEDEDFVTDNNKSFISAEVAYNSGKTDYETDLILKDAKNNVSIKETHELPLIDNSLKHTKDESEEKPLPDTSSSLSMKAADALSHYDIKPDKKETPKKDDPVDLMEYDTEPSIKSDIADAPPVTSKPEVEMSIPEIIKPEQKIAKQEPEPKLVEQESEPKLVKSEPEPDVKKPQQTDYFRDSVNEESKEKPSDEVPGEVTPFIAICPSKPASVPVEVVKKPSISDLDDIIGPDDVFKRIGLDAWFTPERLHPIVEALVYWRDPKKSGIVFGGIMAILIALCNISLISVVAYSSLVALSATICFRIYKNILQAVQKTSEGHPFKEFLDLELSLPQDKVREMVDTAVVHINAYIVELRRLFLVEDLIDSIKFGVCLWCLTYVGAIFNGMTIVILAFVALFTVPKIYENNKASIDTYIEMGRSKVADITSKVKAAVPIGKKEPEKDKEQ